MVGADPATITAATTDIERAVAAYASDHELSDVPHPKHQGKDEYRGVGLHVGFAEVLPRLTAKDIFDAADRGVDRSKSRREHVAGEPGRTAGVARADSGTAQTADRGDGSGTRREAGSGQGRAAGGPGPQEGRRAAELTAAAVYPLPDALALVDFERLAAQVNPSSPESVRQLHVPPLRDAVTNFYEARINAAGTARSVKYAEVARARQYVTETGTKACFVSAEIVNLSGLNQAVGNRAESANVHFRAMADIFEAGLRTCGGQVVPMRTGGGAIGAVVLGVPPAAVAAAAARTDRAVADYVQQYGLSAVPNPKDSAHPGTGLSIEFAEIRPETTPEDILSSVDPKARREARESAYFEALRGDRSLDPRGVLADRIGAGHGATGPWRRRDGGALPSDVSDGTHELLIDELQVATAATESYGRVPALRAASTDSVDKVDQIREDAEDIADVRRDNRVPRVAGQSGVHQPHRKR
ncbi:hypothetical protein ACWDYH_37155 [Nocardia goodfellowii]